MPQRSGMFPAGPGPEPITALQAPENEEVMRKGARMAEQAPGPPKGWDAKSGSAPAAQIHHNGAVHNPRASMTIEMPPAGGVPKGPIVPDASPKLMRASAPSTGSVLDEVES